MGALTLPRRVSVLGSTGSVGVSTLDLLDKAKAEVEVSALTAGRNVERLAQQALRWRPKLAVMGCLPARFGQDLRQGLPEVDVWGLPSELDVLPGRLAEALGAAEAMPTGRLASTPPSYAYLKIAEGCDHACRYCTIPSIRGPLVSKPLDALVEESRLLLDKGASELVVVAQDVAAYGRDLGMKEGLKQLLEKLLPLNGLKWLRLLYLYPSGVTDTLLSFLAGAGRPFLP